VLSFLASTLYSAEDSSEGSPCSYIHTVLNTFESMVIKQNDHVKALLGKSLILLLSASPKYRTMWVLRFTLIISLALLFVCFKYTITQEGWPSLHISCTLSSSPCTCLIWSRSFCSKSLKEPFSASRIPFYKIIIISTKRSFCHDWPHPFYWLRWCPQSKWSVFSSHHVLSSQVYELFLKK